MKYLESRPKAALWLATMLTAVGAWLIGARVEGLGYLGAIPVSLAIAFGAHLGLRPFTIRKKDQ